MYGNFRSASNKQRGHLKQKQVSDKSVVGETLHVGDKVWLFVPAVMNGTTIFIMEGTVHHSGHIECSELPNPTYWGNQKQVVHKNCLKLCLSDPEGTISSQPPQHSISTGRNQNNGGVS